MFPRKSPNAHCLLLTSLQPNLPYLHSNFYTKHLAMAPASRQRGPSFPDQLAANPHKQPHRIQPRKNFTNIAQLSSQAPPVLANPQFSNASLPTTPIALGSLFPVRSLLQSPFLLAPIDHSSLPKTLRDNPALAKKTAANTTSQIKSHSYS